MVQGARQDQVSLILGWVRGGESSDDGGLEAARLMFRTEAESPLELSLVGVTSGRHGLTIYNSPHRELADSWDTGPMTENRLLEYGERGICGAAVAGGARFCISSMDE